MAVPDTNSFSLDNVRVELGLSEPTSLTACFSSANSSGFDSAYSGSKNSLYNFRNYSHIVGTTSVILSTEKSGSNACVKYSAGETSTYYIPQGQSFSNATNLYSNSSGTSFAPANFYSNGIEWRAWDGSSFTISGSC